MAVSILSTQMLAYPTLFCEKESLNIVLGNSHWLTAFDQYLIKSWNYTVRYKLISIWIRSNQNLQELKYITQRLSQDSNPEICKSSWSFQYITRLLKATKRKKRNSFPMAACFLRKEENCTETIISLKLLKSYFLGMYW